MIRPARPTLAEVSLADLSSEHNDSLETVNLIGTVEAATQIPALAARLKAMLKGGQP